MSQLWVITKVDSASDKMGWLARQHCKKNIITIQHQVMLNTILRFFSLPMYLCMYISVQNN